MDFKLKDIEAIYHAALEKQAGRERAAYLNSACGGNAALRKHVEALLKAGQEAGNFLDTPPVDIGTTFDDAPLTESPGTVIGRYKLLEKIGEGGMAVVYMAEQAPSTRSVPFGPACTGVLSDSEGTIRRKVALKIIKLGMDTKQVIARFEAERQALAMMDHPNIAKVLDAGATETGRPYFVMELVKGVSITDYCDANSLNTNERLKLFAEVCNAVQHAHQKGIIHRDIKPSNVMVTHHDGKPVPKVIDFGIAKAINQKLTEKTLFTRYAHIIGTPAYMSPEQAELSDLDIDTRTDIYSLGVLLYELLTGTPPFAEEELRKAGYLEMQRIIREQEPVRPSTRLSTLGGTLTDIAKHRSATPEVLTKTVRGDLDWIVMKALEKDRSRRYEAAEDLAKDIQRHQEHRPVLAHAPSTGYRLHKFLRRHRSEAISGVAIVIGVGTIIILSIWNQYQVRLAEAEGVRQVNVLSEARSLVAKGDFASARKSLRPILESKHVGLEARVLFANTLVQGQEPEETVRGTEVIMERHYRERVQHYTQRIQADPEDPNNYLQRAQQYHYLRQEQNVHADMSRYAAILTQGRFPALQFGAPHNIKRVIDGLFGHQIVFSAERPVHEIPILNVAFGQKGRCSMKSFRTPMLSTCGVGASLFVVCLLSGLDSPPVYADFTFGEAQNLGAVINTSSGEVVDCISQDGREMYFDRKSVAGNYDIYVSRRAASDSIWDTPDDLGPLINTSTHNEAGASISADGLTLYYTSDGPGGFGSGDIWITARATEEAPWAVPMNIGQKVNSSAFDGYPSISPDGLELYFVSYRAGGYGNGDIWVTRRATEYAPWDEPVNLGPTVNSVYYETNPLLSPDGLLLFFSDHPSGPRPGGYGDADIWMARRATLLDPWQTPVNLGLAVNGPSADVAARLSPDGSALFFASRRPGGYGDYDIWQAPIIPVCDFNSDGVVDITDVFIMLEHWHTDYSLCDIGPMPWGDGIVDAQDLIVLAEHMANNPADVNDVNSL